MARIVGILLAAGRAERFGGAKLLAPLRAEGSTAVEVGVASLRNLRAALPDVIAVVRPGDDALARRLADEGARIVRAARADEGMGASLAAGVAAAGNADGYVVALADMPWVRPGTHVHIVTSLADGALIAAPRFTGVRGHPVGFAAALRDELLALAGDEGAKRVLAAHAGAVALLDVDDPGVVRDVDTRADLGR